MGREVKRVAADFNWPLGKTWEGYLNPHYRKCPDCEDGYTAARKALQRIVHLLMIAGENSLKRPADFQPARHSVSVPVRPGGSHQRLYPHPYLIEAGIFDPGTDLHELTTGLAGRPLEDRFFGHDSCDRWAAEEKIIKAAKLPKTWGTCKTCDGDAIDPAVRAAYEAWTQTEPPAGPAYQIWETVSEGSPVSPPFLEPDDLAAWMVVHDTSITSSTTSEQWLAFIRKGGSAPSLIVSEAGVQSGVQAVADAEGGKNG